MRLPAPGRCLPLLLLLALPGAPEQVMLEPLPAMELGRAYNLTCRVLNVAPVGNLSVTLLRGGRALHTETFRTHSGAELDNVTVTHEISPGRWDHGQQVTCQASLDLAPRGPRLQSNSSAAELRVFALPAAPWLEAPPHVEEGAEASAHCGVAGIFPAAEARLSLTLGGERLDPALSTSGDTASAQAPLPFPAPGEYELNCTVAVGPLSRSAARRVLLYRFPPPVLELDPPRALVNRNVNVSCRAPAPPPPGLTLRLRDSVHTLASGPRPHLQLRLTARKGDNGRRFTCEGSFALGGQSLVKTTSAQLTVLYKPTLAEPGCPSRRTWLEGSLQQLACEADGNPPPEVSCSKDGRVDEAGGLWNVTRGQAGVYLCHATNVHGQDSRNVTVLVEYGPEMDEAGCARTQTWVEGTEQTLACRARGHPAPVVACTRDRVSLSVGVPCRVAREHAGTYRCTASNARGSASREVTVQVEYKPAMDETGCPSAWTWLKGTPQTFSCSASGLPAPAVVCTKEGTSHRLGQGPGLAAPPGTYQCNATNPHGWARKNVTITLESKPEMSEAGCPGNQTWLEGTLRSLACAADGVPAPRVPCTKEGAAHEFGGERNVSRSDSGTYWCTASNRHGAARRAVSVRVEYRPVIVLLAASPSAAVAHRANFSVSCRAEGSPAPAYRWALPPAPNLRYSADNSTVSVAGAGPRNSGRYQCVAANAHGQHQGQLHIQVADHRLLVATLPAVAALLLLGGAAGLAYYLKSTACKRGEYNVQDAESSAKAACLAQEPAGLHRVQLPQP